MQEYGTKVIVSNPLDRRKILSAALGFGIRNCDAATNGTLLRGILTLLEPEKLILSCAKLILSHAFGSLFPLSLSLFLTLSIDGPF